MAVGAANAQSGLATTTIADTVYMADGTPAAGTLIITWPAFVTAGGAQVAAGSTNVTLGAQGSLSAALVPNASATPAGVYYSVVYQLGPGQIKTESWVVPASATPVNLAAVRATPGSGVAGQPVSMQYVNSGLAAKANDNAVVHLSGNETITGTKTFGTAPNVPAPVNPGDVASKGYVDQAVSNVGAGNYLPTAGGTMTGPITLPGNPAAPMQASTKNYVDSSLNGKADLVSGLVPANELGTGQATAGNCLTGNGTWAPCSAGGTGNLSTNPAASQTIAQPVGTQFSTNNLANIRYVTTSWNWLQRPSDDLSTPGSETIHLSPCPLGLDTTSSANYYSYKVYIAGTGTAEAVPVTGGSCAPGTSGGTIIVSTTNAHPAGYTVSSASSGIQEAWNDAWTADVPASASSTTAPYVKLVADATYNVYATVYLRGRGGVLDGTGALIACSTRDRCLYVGTTQGQPFVHHHKLYNLTGTSSVNVDGVQVANVSATSGTYTVTTASNHPFSVGDMVDCEYYSQNAGQHWVSTITGAPSSTSFTVTIGNANFAASANTFGFCGLLNAFIENNSDHVAIQDINLTQMSGIGMGMFSYGIVDDNDQQFIIERATNRSSAVIRSDANFPMGAFVYERTDQGNAGITYVHDSEFTNVNCAQAGGNGFVMSDTVCQGFPVYGVRYFGGYQPATFTNVYQESTGGNQNPLYGYAAQMGYAVQGGVGTKFVGTFPTSGFEPMFASGGSGTNERTYFVVPRSSTMGYGPLIFAGYAQPSASTANVTVTWPSIELQDAYYHQSLGALTWDILVTVGQSAAVPYGTGTFAIATNAAVSCGTNGMCSFADTQTTPVSYTVPSQQFTPVFWFWPNNLILNNTTVFLDAAGADPGAVASQGTSGVSIVSAQCTTQGVTRRRSPIWVSCLTASGNFGAGMFGTVLQQQDASNNGPFANSKGRLNFGKPIGAPNDLITLADSNFLKTVTTAGERPSNDAGDMAIGLDQSGGLAERAGSSISSYINVVPNGTNFLERLTSSSKTVNVPLTVNGNFTVSNGTVSLPVTGTGPQCLHVSSTGMVSGTGADCGSGGGGSDPVTVNAGVSSQVAMYSGNGSAVNGDSTLTDNGTTLSYAGTGGIAANSGSFSGNVTVNGQLQVAGPWMVSSPIPGAVMSASGPGTSSLGVSNDGNFYISANGNLPQEVATTATSSYFPNLWQEDTNDIGAYNGANPQGLHVYGTTDGTNYDRIGLLYDTTSQDFLVSSDWAGSGAARNLGLRTGSSVKWEVTTNGLPYALNALRPYADLGATVGDAFHRPQFNYSNANVIVLPNSSTGTIANYLAKAVSSGTQEQAQTVSTSDTSAIGIVVAGAGTTGTSASIARSGEALCAFDGAVTLNDYVTPSTTAGGQCHDSGSATSCPSGQVIGRAVLQTTGNNYYVLLGNDSCGAGPGAPVNSPTFAGTVTLPDGTTDSSSGISLVSALTLPSGSTAATPVSTDNSTKVATTAWVKGQGYGAFPSGSEGNTLVNSSTGSGSSYAPVLYEFHSSGFPSGTTLQAMLATCPATGSCRVVLDPGQTIPAGSTYPVVIGPGYNASTWQKVTVYNNGGNLQCTLTGASQPYPDCIQIGEWGELLGDNDGNGTAGGATITTVPNATYRNIVSNAGVCAASCNTAGAGATGYLNYLTQRFTFRGNGINPTGTSSITGALLSLTAVEGRGDVEHIGLSGLRNTTSLLLQDGPNSGSNNSLYFKDIVSVCSGFAGCLPINILSNAGGNGMNMLFEEVGFDGSSLGTGCHSGAGCLINIDGTNGGTKNSGYLADIIFHGAYTEVASPYPSWTANNAYALGNSILQSGTYFSVTTAGTSGGTAPTWTSCTTTCTDGSVTWTNAGTTSPSHVIEGYNVRDLEIHGLNLNAGAVGTCVMLGHGASSYLGRVSITGRIGSGHCTTLLNNTVTGYTIAGTSPTDLDYTFAGEQTNPGAVYDGGIASSTSLTASGTVTLPDGTTNTSGGFAFGHALTMPSGSSGTTQSAKDGTTKIATDAYADGEVAGATVPYVVFAGYNSANQPVFPTTTNTAAVYSFELPFAVTTSKVAYKTGTTADNTSNTYEIGIYNANGTLVLSYQAAGTSFAAAASTMYRQSWSQGTTTLAPGRYYEAITTNCSSSCATYWGSSSTTAAYYSNSALTVTSGGTLPGSITAPGSGYESFGANTLSIILE